MTVIHNRNEDENHGQSGDPKTRKCALCGEKPYCPFLWWLGGKRDLCICNTCCRALKDGFAADLIEINAIMELHEIYGGAYTLVRKPTNNLAQPGAWDMPPI
jgi:hypothetical protein